MKKYILALSSAFFLFACSSETASVEEAVEEVAEVVEEEIASTGTFGDAIEVEGALSVDELLAQLEETDSIPLIKVSAEITGVCQKKGCWMTVPLGGDEEMMIRFKDYGFFVPMNAMGNKAVFEGTAYRTVTTVEELRHYAEDAGDSQEAIDAITEPLEEIAFLANGVVITE